MKREDSLEGHLDRVEDTLDDPDRTFSDPLDEDSLLDEGDPLMDDDLG